MSRFELLSRNGIHVLRCESAQAPAGRYFLRYRARRDFRWLMGHAVVDEFATVSSPLFFGPRQILGRLYNLGISLGHGRDPELGIDLGWPPFCVGLDVTAPPPALEWEAGWLAMLQTETGVAPDNGVAGVSRATADGEGWVLDRWDFHGQVMVLATDAPLLPEQLQRLCDADARALTVAVATGNRLQHGKTGGTGAVRALSEAGLDGILEAAAALSGQT